MEKDEDLVVELTVASAAAEIAAMRLWDAGATAVGFDEGPETTVLTASFPTAAATRLVAGEVGGRAVATDPSWRDAWKAYAAPFEVGERLVVAPAWRDVEVGGRTVLAIDPGACFGSGTHASTRLVLAALDADPPAGLSVVDVGCGSGVLSVAAARLGATRVTAVDIDPEAVTVTRFNAEANGVADRVDVSTTPVEQLAGPFDLALVNLTAGVHARLGPAVARLVRPGGALILAGLLPGQWRHVARAYEETTVAGHPELDGWEGVLLLK